MNVCLQAFQAPKAGRETKRLALDHRLGYSCTWREVASSTPADESVTECVTSSLSQWMSIRFDPETLGELRSIARQKGIGPTTLIRLWVMERMRGAERSGILNALEAVQPRDPHSGQKPLAGDTPALRGNSLPKKSASK